MDATFALLLSRLLRLLLPFLGVSRISLECLVTVVTARTIQLKFEEVSLRGQQLQPLPVPTSVGPGTFVCV